MSVQVEWLPHHRSISLSAKLTDKPGQNPSPLVPSPKSSSACEPAVSVFTRRLISGRNSGPLLPLEHPKIMLSELPSAAAAVVVSPPPNPGRFNSLQSRKEALKLSFGRSISEPFGTQGLGIGQHNCQPPVLSPPSVSPSLHPASKRSRMMEPPATPTSGMPTSPFGNPSLLRPPPGSIATVSLPNSPCSESSTLQRTLLLQKAKTTEPSRLAQRLGNKSGRNFLILDCRPFIAYNVSHIKGAINVNCCDRFNRKRLQQGKATLADLATSKEGKEILKKRNWREIVVYDDCSDSLERLPVSHTLFLVMNALVEDHREPVLLLGGLRDFQVNHRPLCEDHLMAAESPASAHQPMMLQPRSTALLPDLPSPSDLCNTKDIENHPNTQVLPHLYLGNMRDASDASVLKQQGIGFVLNVTAKPPSYVMDPDIVYKQLAAADSGVQNLRQFFEEAFGFIDEAKAAGSGVLVHCHAGVSRSPTIAVAYLMKYYPMAMAEAYKFVKLRRSIISPNLNFMGQLWEFEQSLQALKAGPGAKPSRETLTLEMREVKESLKRANLTPSYLSASGSSGLTRPTHGSCSSPEASPASSSSSSSSSEHGSAGPSSANVAFEAGKPGTGSGSATASALGLQPFRWAEASVVVREQANEEGCSV